MRWLRSRSAPTLPILLIAMLAACGDDDASSDDSSNDDGGGSVADAGGGSPDAAAGDDDGGPVADGSPGTPDAATPDGGTTDGGAPDAGTPDASTPDASTPDAGTPDAGGDAGTPGVDLTGTWVSSVTTQGTITVPLFENQPATIDLTLRIAVTRSGGTLQNHVEVCRLNTVTDDQGLLIDFPTPVLALLTDDQSIPDPGVVVGGPVPIPAFSIVVGQDAQGNPTDDDNNGQPGVTIPAIVLGTPIAAHSSLQIALSFPGVTLVDENTQMGTSSFTTNGSVFDTDPLDLMGSISVTPASPTTPFTATRLPGDVSCSEITAP
ncbi:MAG TPA: hypothetical protein VKB80_23545 [Kofleriaceae bacterium]|nr:hypothetical protein [Kofleriaceae bacterium]